MTVGEFIKKRREELGLTQEQVAEACGVSNASVSLWESGRIENMKISRITALADILNVPPTKLLPDGTFLQSNRPQRIPTDIAQSISRLNPAGLDALRSVLAGFTANPSFVESKQESV